MTKTQLFQSLGSSTSTSQMGWIRHDTTECAESLFRLTWYWVTDRSNHISDNLKAKFKKSRERFNLTMV